jgi:hypothetical protein
MSVQTNLVSRLFEQFFSDKTRKKIENTFLVLALLSFFIHLALIYLLKLDVITLSSNSELLSNPISAIYTPFSFILIYEVYLLIFHLPRSFTTYLTKQYEIITLIIIRRLFKDFSNIELSSNWFAIKADLEFTYDLIASILLYFLIYLFIKQTYKMKKNISTIEPSIQRFIQKKKVIALVLVPVFFSLAIYTFGSWCMTIFSESNMESYVGVNNLFFDEFFTVLILVDVILLLISFFYTDQFYKIIRNSGFIISTILLRMSFGVSGLLSTVLILVAVLFGLAIITIHNKYEKNLDLS